MAAGCVGSLTDAQNHCEDTDSRKDLDEAVQSEAGQGQCFGMRPEIDRHKALERIVENCKNCQPKSIPVITSLLECLRERSHSCFLSVVPKRFLLIAVLRPKQKP